MYGSPRWAPSNGRDVDNISAQAAAQSQPSGAAIPSFIIGDPSSEHEHLAAALAVNPFALLLDHAIKFDVKDSLSRCVASSAAVVSLRTTALSAWEALSVRLNPLRARWVGALGADSPAVGINLPLIQFAISHFGYPDDVFAYDVAMGMPIAGAVPACATLAP